jgi:hypothetical protein
LLNRIAARHGACVTEVMRRWKSPHEKRAGLTPCSKNCVDPVCPANRDLILIGGVTLLLARQGSSRDLDHQTLA